MKCKAVFVELRRTAPLYLDRQGKVIEKLLANYDSVTMAPGGLTRFEEHIGVEDARTGFEARVSGQACVAAKSLVPSMGSDIDIAAFEREARVFSKFVEPMVFEGDYTRLGILFSFHPAGQESPHQWYRSFLGVAPPDPWQTEGLSLRFRNDRGVEGESIALQFWGTNGQTLGLAPEAIRVDVDSYRFNVSQHDALNVNLIDGFKRASSLLEEVIHGAS